MNIGLEVCKRFAQKTGGELNYDSNKCKVELPDAVVEVFPDARARIYPKGENEERMIKAAEQYTNILREVYLEMGLMKK